MRATPSFYLFCYLSLAFAGCEKHATTAPRANNQIIGPIEACGLITREEVQAIQGSAITDVKSSVQTDGTFRVSQCFYTATDFVKSVSLSVTQSAPDKVSAKRRSLDFWKERFERSATGKNGEDRDAAEKNAERTKAPEEAERKSIPPKAVAGLGDEAFWIANSGSLYVLKGDAFFRIGLGGKESETDKIKMATALAESALRRF